MDREVECPFCWALEDGHSPCWDRLFGSGSPGDVLKIGTYFSTLADTAPIVEGHLLIVSNPHIPSFAATAPPMRTELWEMKKRMVTWLAEVYQRPTLLEHGAASFARNAGSCVDHAHLHLVPAQLDLLPQLAADYPNLNRFDSHAAALDAMRGHPYLYFEDVDGRCFATVAARCPTQYLRRLSTEAARNPDRWNWRDCIRRASFTTGIQDEVRDTVRKARRDFI
ncbi:HIT domain-containing protein [Micromonospora sp. NPDC047793]|uniref:HIT family protein n=1 Tax=Micromonospora sp. NPDC047793 TaxID=3154342 RepID=UPI0033DFBBFB